jgi:putative ABC transport system substrate-binding protein
MNPTTGQARIGFLCFGSRRAALDSGRYAALVRGLRELGRVEGRNLAIEARFADGSAERLASSASELLSGKPDAVVASGAAAGRALRRATSALPIVVASSADPVAEGLAASLARPAGNVTGIVHAPADFTAPRQLGLLDAIVPQLATFAVLFHRDNAAHAEQLARVAAAAQAIGRQTLPVEARDAAGIEAGLAAASRRSEAAIVLDDPLFVDQMRPIAEWSLRFLLPRRSRCRPSPRSAACSATATTCARASIAPRYSSTAS